MIPFACEPLLIEGLFAEGREARGEDESAWRIELRFDRECGRTYDNPSRHRRARLGRVGVMSVRKSEKEFHSQEASDKKGIVLVKNIDQLVRSVAW